MGPAYVVVGIRSDTTRKEFYVSHTLSAALSGVSEVLRNSKEQFTEVIVELREVVQVTKVEWRVELKWKTP